MQTPDEIRRDLLSDLEPSEGETLVAIGMRLREQVPRPAPGFRGELGRRLVRRENRDRGLVAPRLARMLAACYVGSGLLLLAIAAAGLAGAGPFSAA